MISLCGPIAVAVVVVVVGCCRALSLPQSLSLFLRLSLSHSSLVSVFSALFCLLSVGFCCFHSLSFRFVLLIIQLAGRRQAGVVG